MIVEDAVGCANDGLVATVYVPRQTNARRKIVLVARESLLHADRVLSSLQVGRSERDAGQRVCEAYGRNRVRQFNVVAHAVVQRQILTNLPRILREEGNRAILNCAVGIAEAFDEDAGKSKAVGLHGRNRWRCDGQPRNEVSKRACGNAAEVKEAGEVQIKSRAYVNEVDVAAELEVVCAVNNIHVVCKLITLLRAINGRERVRAYEGRA